MAKTKKVEQDIYALIDESIDQIEKKFNLESAPMEDIPPMSTGILSWDLLTGGGIRPAMYTSAGFEQSGKTTSVITILASSVKQKIHIRAFYDYEGSTGSSGKYVRNIFSSVGLNYSQDEIFGKKDIAGRVVQKAVVRYRSEYRLSAFFDYVHAVLKELPDKKMIEGSWWLKFDDTKTNRKNFESDSGIEKRHGKGVWVKASDNLLQAIFFIDSYTGMLPSGQDKDDVNNALALQAREFAIHIPRVKGLLAQKMCAIIGINQMREVPMAMFGPKERETGGVALRQFSDVRISHKIRSVSASPFSAGLEKDKDFNEQEKSVLVKDGHDTYRYIALATVKNKLSMPSRKSFMRIWVKDGRGEARGIDPVFDTLFYLKETGQLDGPRKKIKLNLHKVGQAETSWYELKKWILGDVATQKMISKKLFKKQFSLRGLCFKQMQSGVAELLYSKLNNSKSEDNEDYE